MPVALALPRLLSKISQILCYETDSVNPNILMTDNLKAKLFLVQ